MEPADTTVPTVSIFSPTDGATNAGLSDNIQLKFSEAIQRGTGNIVLKTASGTVIATYNAAFSSNIAISGDTLVINPSGNLTYSTGYQVEFAAGTIEDLAGNAYAGTTSYNFTTQAAPLILSGSDTADTLTGSTGNDVFDGGNGNDIFNGQEGNDTLNGGSGKDIAIYSGMLGDFSVQKNDSGFTVSDNVGSEGIDVLIDIERAIFSDLALAFDLDGVAGEAYRLYQAAFVREPDLPGLGWQINAMDNGVNLEQIAQNFLDSVEFKTLYGDNLSDGDLVVRLYLNVLGREPEQAGYDHWINMLSTQQMSRAEVLYYFSESEENQALVIGAIENGIEYQSFA